MVMALAPKFSDEHNPMQDADFMLWQNLVEDATGIWLPSHRKSFLLTQLQSRVRTHGLENYRSYYDKLINHELGKQEWAALIDLLTVHETRFFRDKKAMELVQNFTRNRIEKLKMRSNQARSVITRNILEKSESKCVMQFWSVGCASGEEAYSLAMMLENIAEKIPAGNHFYFGVRGTDISFPSLAVAREAKYSANRMAAIPEQFIDSYAEKINDSQYRINPGVQEKVCFVQENLSDLDCIPFQTYDVIYCQNVLIYFKPERKKIILDALVNRLNQNGLLVLAPGEATNWQHQEMQKQSNSECLSFIKKAPNANDQWREYGKK